MRSSTWSTLKLRRLAFLGCLSVTGCAAPGVFHSEPVSAKAPFASDDESIRPVSALEQAKPKQAAPFELPESLPGAEATPIVPPRFNADTPAAERQKAIKSLYPATPDKGPPSSKFAEGEKVSLNSFLDLAYQNSPALRKARATAEATSGAVVQAGLYPNPTVGYQADQWVTASPTSTNSGQQGAFYNQTIKFPGKLTLAQAIAGFDFMNAQVAVRRAQIDIANQVRTAYFSALVAQQSVETNSTLLQVLNETYELQLKQLAGGEAAGYEPLQLYAQAVQAKNNLTIAENTAKNAWRQLVAAIGIPDMKQVPLAGKADAPAPVFEQESLLSRILELHTDVVTARNSLEQAKVNVRLQKLTPYPDLLTNTVFQHDNALSNTQFNLQMGISLPLFDRNQGNIQKAIGEVRAAQESVNVAQNSLRGQLSEAFYRYETNRAVAVNYREKIIPNLTRAYRAIIRRYQVEPDKVSFNDIVVAQQNLAQALQSHLTALDAQWKALADLASTAQLDELDVGK